MNRWEQIKAKEKSTTDYKAFIERVPEAKRKRMKKRPKVTDTEKLSIAYSVMIDKEY